MESLAIGQSLALWLLFEVPVQDLDVYFCMLVYGSLAPILRVVDVPLNDLFTFYYKCKAS